MTSPTILSHELIGEDARADSPSSPRSTAEGGWATRALAWPATRRVDNCVPQRKRPTRTVSRGRALSELGGGPGAWAALQGVSATEACRGNPEWRAGHLASSSAHNSRELRPRPSPTGPHRWWGVPAVSRTASVHDKSRAAVAASCHRHNRTSQSLVWSSRACKRLRSFEPTAQLATLVWAMPVHMLPPTGARPSLRCSGAPGALCAHSEFTVCAPGLHGTGSTPAPPAFSASLLLSIRLAGRARRILRSPAPCTSAIAVMPVRIASEHLTHSLLRIC